MHRYYLQKRKREQMRSEWRRYRQKQKRKRDTGRKETREDEIQMAKVEADEELTIKQMELNAQARTRAMMAMCHEDGEGAFMCGNVERPRSSRSFQHFSAEIRKMEPTLRSAQVLKQEAEEIGLEGKDIPDYVKRHQALDREQKAAWRNLLMAKIQADAEKEKREEEIQKAQSRVNYMGSAVPDCTSAEC